MLLLLLLDLFNDVDPIDQVLLGLLPMDWLHEVVIGVIHSVAEETALVGLRNELG